MGAEELKLIKREISKRINKGNHNYAPITLNSKLNF